MYPEKRLRWSAEALIERLSKLKAADLHPTEREQLVALNSDLKRILQPWGKAGVPPGEIPPCGWPMPPNYLDQAIGRLCKDLAAAMPKRATAYKLEDVRRLARLKLEVDKVLATRA